MARICEDEARYLAEAFDARFERFLRFEAEHLERFGVGSGNSKLTVQKTGSWLPKKDHKGRYYSGRKIKRTPDEIKDAWLAFGIWPKHAVKPTGPAAHPDVLDYT